MGIINLMSMSISLRTCIFFVCSILINACNPLFPAKPDSETIVTRGFARNNEKPEEGPLYCYDTLADKVCYTRPLYDDDERLTGYYGPRP